MENKKEFRINDEGMITLIYDNKSIFHGTIKDLAEEEEGKALEEFESFLSRIQKDVRKVLKCKKNKQKK